MARFGDRVTLLDASCTCDGDGQVQLAAYWQVEEPVEVDLTVFAHLLDPQGSLVAQADGYPLLGLFPFWLWEPGETVRDVRHFSPGGGYAIRLGVWEPASGERLPATAPDGTSWPDQAFPIGPCACESPGTLR